MALEEARIGLAHGIGDRYMRELIREVAARHVRDDVLVSDRRILEELEDDPLPRIC